MKDTRDLGESAMRQVSLVHSVILHLTKVQVTYNQRILHLTDRSLLRTVDDENESCRREKKFSSRDTNHFHMCRLLETDEQQKYLPIKYNRFSSSLSVFVSLSPFWKMKRWNICPRIVKWKYMCTVFHSLLLSSSERVRRQEKCSPNNKWEQIILQESGRRAKWHGWNSH